MINQQRPAVKFLHSKVRRFAQLSAQTFPSRRKRSGYPRLILRWNEKHAPFTKKRDDPVPKELVNARHTLDYNKCRKDVAHQTVRGDSSHSWLSSLENLFHLNKIVLFSSMAFLRRRPSVPSFRNNRVLQQYVLTQARRQGGCKGVHMHPPFEKVMVIIVVGS